MKLKVRELKVFYKGELNVKLDEAVEKVLKTFGYRRWASGMNLVESVRDLAFECDEDQYYKHT